MALIFAVDDDPQVRGLLKVLFEDQGHEVLLLESGKHCLDRLDENPACGVVPLPPALHRRAAVRTAGHGEAQRLDLRVLVNDRVLARGGLR